MLGHTHALIGLGALVTVELVARQVLEPGLVQPHQVRGVPVGLALCAGAAILGALAPDLDAEEATIQHEMGMASEFIQGVLLLVGVKHRGVLHSGLASLMALALGVFIGWRVGYPDVGLAFGLGYLSHVALADALTIHGVPLLWPMKTQCHLLPQGLRVQTGSPVEGLIFLACMLLLIGLFFLYPDLIPPELVRWIRQSLSGMVIT
jgi:membrane-bound metal-dependent hydrolase YbcI (DUF457 family)